MQKHKKLVAESVAIIKDAIANGIDFEVFCKSFKFLISLSLKHIKIEETKNIKSF